MKLAKRIPRSPESIAACSQNDVNGGVGESPVGQFGGRHRGWLATGRCCPVWAAYSGPGQSRDNANCRHGRSRRRGRFRLSKFAANSTRGGVSNHLQFQKDQKDGVQIDLRSFVPLCIVVYGLRVKASKHARRDSRPAAKCSCEVRLIGVPEFMCDFIQCVIALVNHPFCRLHFRFFYNL